MSEHLTRINRTRRRTHQHNQTIRGRVRRRNHIFHSTLRKDLRLIQHQHIDLSETTAKPILASTKQNARPISELDSLTISASQRAMHKRAHTLRLRQRTHRPESLIMRLSAMRRPQHQLARMSKTQRKHQRANRIRLPRLPRNRHHRATNTTRILTISTLTHQHRQQVLLPPINRDPHTRQLPSNNRPVSLHNPIRNHQMPCKLR